MAWPRQDAGAIQLSLLRGSGIIGLCHGQNGEQCAGLGDVVRAAAIGQQPVMADAVEALWQHMQQKAPDELVRVERHGLVSLWPFDPVILVFEGDAIRIGRD